MPFFHVLVELSCGQLLHFHRLQVLILYLPAASQYVLATALDIRDNCALRLHAPDTIHSEVVRALRYAGCQIHLWTAVRIVVERIMHCSPTHWYCKDRRESQVEASRAYQNISTVLCTA